MSAPDRERRRREVLYKERVLRACADDFWTFIRYISIEDKSTRSGERRLAGALLPHQKIFIRSLLTERRVFLLKARQLGATEITMCYILWRMLFQPGFAALVLAQGEKYAKNSIKRLRRIYGSLPAWMRANFPMPNSATGTFVLKFHNGRESIVVAEPATETAGASMTLDFVFLDEFALMELGAEVYDTVVPTLDFSDESERDGCVLLVCSTARGGTNRFAQMWRRDETFRKHFFPWWCSPVYSRRKYERDRAQYRRRGEEHRIFSERPSSPEEAFRQSGAGRFSNLPDIATCAAAQHRYQILEDENHGVYLEEDIAGPLYLVVPKEEIPFSLREFVIGADHAMGVGKDSSAAVIGSYDSQSNIEIWGYYANNRIEPKHWGSELAQLGRLFSTPDGRRPAFLVPEAQNSGGGGSGIVMDVLHTENYQSLYVHVRRGPNGVQLGSQHGFPLNTATRTPLIDELAAVLHPNDDGEYRILNLPATVHDQLGSFVRNEKTGKVQADHGANDDLVIALALLVRGLARLDKPALPEQDGTPTAVETFGNLHQDLWNQIQRDLDAASRQPMRISRYHRTTARTR